jgi:hypothetical protein
VLFATLALPAAAHAVVEPPQIVGGADSKWISGDLIQQTGLNCSTAILGSSYTEVMVSGVASYGGLNRVPKVGDQYWTAFLVAIPGNPCGTGSSSVVTTLVMPPNTDVDTSRQVKCYGLPRNHDDTTPWLDLTNESWSFLNQSGPYCAHQPTVSPYHQGGLQFGFRPLANGQFFWMFVPVKSTAPLVGAGHSPPDGFYWLTDATGVYANPGLSTVWANVLPGGSTTEPFIFSTHEPAIQPYWDKDAEDLAPANPGDPPMPTHSRAEWFGDLYSAFEPGYFCWEMYRGATATGTPEAVCNDGKAGPWNGNVLDYSDSWFIEGGGPHKGYMPFSYDDEPPGTTHTVRYTFTYAGGAKQVHKDFTFRTLNGPDLDGDGVGANEDSCPDLKGTLSNGCNVPTQPDPDQDGVYGDADKCPAVPGNGALNGCPGGIVPDPPKNVLTGILSGIKKGATLKKSALAKGLVVKYTCTVDSTAKGSLAISKKTASKLKIKTKKKQKSVTIASGKGSCSKAAGGTLKLKLAKAYASKVKRTKKKFPATLSVGLTAPSQTPVTMKQSVKVG